MARPRTLKLTDHMYEELRLAAFNERCSMIEIIRRGLECYQADPTPGVGVLYDRGQSHPHRTLVTLSDETAATFAALKDSEQRNVSSIMRDCIALYLGAQNGTGDRSQH